MDDDLMNSTHWRLKLKRADVPVDRLVVPSHHSRSTFGDSTFLYSIIYLVEGETQFVAERHLVMIHESHYFSTT